MSSEGIAVFFDIGDTLASPVIQGGALAGLEVYPFVPEVLTRMRAAGEGVAVSLGLISNTGDATAATMNDLLATSGLKSLVDAHLCLFSSVEGMDKSQPAFFALARARAERADRLLRAADRALYAAKAAGRNCTLVAATDSVDPTADVPSASG